MKQDMTQGNPFKIILLFAIPILLGNMFQNLYNMVDSIIVGRLLGTNALAAVGTTGPVNFMIMGFIFGLTSGYAVVTAQAFGSKDEERLIHQTKLLILQLHIFPLFTAELQLPCFTTLVPVFCVPLETVKLLFTF